MPAHPTTAEGLSAAYLTGLLAHIYPGTTVTSVAVVEARTYGEQMVSTSGRVALDVGYEGAHAARLPARIVVKLGRGVDTIMAPFYANEVAFYAKIRPELDIETPRVLGAAFDRETSSFALALEDLTARRARFPNVLEPTSIDDVKSLLDTLARLHAQFWESHRFTSDLAWVETHVEGGVARMMNDLAPAYIQHEIDTQAFKRELVQRLRTTGPALLAGVQAVQRHQARLPHTLLHGDTHLGNSYLVPDGPAGLLDWQLMVRGYAMHDVSYLIATSLSIADRRAHDRELLAYYLDRLAALGCSDPPHPDVAWTEMRRALIWGVYIGWLTTPVVNYGWEINVVNHLRLTTAYEDYETSRLVAELF